MSDTPTVMLELFKQPTWMEEIIFQALNYTGAESSHLPKQLMPQLRVALEQVQLAEGMATTYMFEYEHGEYVVRVTIIAALADLDQVSNTLRHFVKETLKPTLELGHVSSGYTKQGPKPINLPRPQQKFKDEARRDITLSRVEVDYRNTSHELGQHHEVQSSIMHVYEPGPDVRNISPHSTGYLAPKASLALRRIGEATGTFGPTPE